MRTDAVRCWIWALLLAAAALGFGQEAKPASKASPPALLRMENLRPRQSPPAPAKRDIFSPGGFLAPAGSASGFRPEAGGAGRPAGERGAAGETEAAEAEAPPAPAYILRFVGYSFNASRNRTVGLILLDGSARAVMEGDELPHGLKIVRVGRDMIEVQEADGNVLTFSLEGVQR